MAFEKFANLAETTLSAGYTAGAGSISVTSAAGFPTAGVFRVRLGNAGKTIFRVDSVSGTTFTGAAEANDANAANGDSATCVLSAGAMGQLVIPLFTSGADAPTTGTTAETLYTFTMPGGTLAVDGEAIRILAAFSFAANANNKSIVVNFGGTTISGTGQAGFNNSTIWIDAIVARLGATTQKAIAMMYFNADQAPSALGGANIIGTTNGNISSTAPGETLSGDIVIASRGLSPSAAGDVTAKCLHIFKIPKV